MRTLVIVGLGFSMLAACSTGSSIKDLPDQDVSKAPAQWKDPGAVPDAPRDAGGVESMDATIEAGPSVDDAGGIDGSLADAQAGDAGAQDAGPVDAN